MYVSPKDENATLADVLEDRCFDSHLLGGVLILGANYLVIKEK